MKGDFSRITFDRTNHYRGVRWQQGRPTTDADFNEAHDIAAYRTEREAWDTLGPSGTPKAEPGFALSADGATIRIGAGRFYVQGLLAENEAPLAYEEQPDLPDAPSLLDQLDKGQIGLVYLDVFERHLTHQDRADISDVALNGVDSTTRVQSVWQVKLLPLDTLQLLPSSRQELADLTRRVAELTAAIADETDPVKRAILVARRREAQRRLRAAAERIGVGCDMPLSEWTELTTPPSGALLVTTVPGDEITTPCDVPPGGGYTRGENQLYRVEVHSVPKDGGRNGATFKWSRDNGSVVARITAVGNATAGSASGLVFDVDRVQRDDYLGIHTNDVVEYCDDGYVLNGVPGELRRVTNADVNLGRLTLDSSLTVNLDRNPMLRKWDQPAGAVAMNTTTSPIPLENGIQVAFRTGRYRPGDYWTFAARSVDGSIDFPETPQAAFGITHHYARLGLVTVEQGALALLLDCRPPFPALTALTADDVAFDNSNCQMPDSYTVQDALEQLCARASGAGQCTIHLSPGATWESALAQIPDGADALICFARGEYELGEPVMIEGKGHLRLRGVGDGTRVIAAGENAFTFRQCDSVTVLDMAISANSSEAVRNLQGVVTTVNCPRVEVDGVTLRCAANSVRAAACLRVMNDRKSTTLTNGRGTVEVRNSRFLVAHNQIGVLVTNCTRATVENNLILSVDGRSDDHYIRTGLDKNRTLLAEARRTLLSGIEAGRSDDHRRENLLLGNVAINFLADPALRELKFFAQMVERFPPRRVVDLATARRYMMQTVGQLMRNPSPIARFDRYLQRLVRDDSAALYQGITIGGEIATDVRIRNNTIVGALQGIHIGQSARGSGPLSAGTVQISGNTISTRITPAVNREAHGILVGNVESLLIEDNRVEREPVEATEHLAFDGIHAEGIFGRRLIVRHNHIERHRFGVYVVPNNPQPEQEVLWLVADNVASVRTTSALVRSENNVS